MICVADCNVVVVANGCIVVSVDCFVGCVVVVRSS